MSPVPVTIVTGFLGSGKTTLLDRILAEQHGQCIAVIENEFGAAGIDHELLMQYRDAPTATVEMNSGCICCTMRPDLVRTLAELHARRAAGTPAFERVLIETTGLADPAPVARSFFVDDAMRERYRLDAVITMVDAVHAPAQLDLHHEAQRQVRFADRILLSKTDLVPAEQVRALEQRLRRMNPRARIAVAHFGHAPLERLLDVRGFDLDTILQLEPEFLAGMEHRHCDDVSSFVFRSARPLHAGRLEEFFHAIVAVQGRQMLRCKGVLWIIGIERRVVLQGVHALLGCDHGATWRTGEPRESRIVFIGRQLPEATMLQGLEQCLFGAAPATRPLESSSLH